jgi:transposase
LDVRDAEWARLEPLIPPALLDGRSRKTGMRAAMNAILYLLRTGCSTAQMLDWFKQAGREPHDWMRQMY